MTKQKGQMNESARKIDINRLTDGQTVRERNVVPVYGLNFISAQGVCHMTRRTKACERKGLQQHSMGGKEKAVQSLSNNLENPNPNDFKNKIFSYPNQNNCYFPR